MFAVFPEFRELRSDSPVGKGFALLAQQLEVTMSCSHTNCRCDDATLERQGKIYCSEQCAAAEVGTDSREACRCAHPGCTAI